MGSAGAAPAAGFWPTPSPTPFPALSGLAPPVAAQAPVASSSSSSSLSASVSSTPLPSSVRRAWEHDVATFKTAELCSPAHLEKFARRFDLPLVALAPLLISVVKNATEEHGRLDDLAQAQAGVRIGLSYTGVGDKRHVDGGPGKGTVHICIWPGKGHSNADEFVLSADCAGKGGRVAALKEYGDALEPAIELASVMQEICMPDEFREMRARYQLTMRDGLVPRLLGAGAEHLIYQGIAVVHDMPSVEHLDESDAESTMACMVPCGDYDGAQLYCPTIGLVLNYELGDVVLLHADACAHEVLGYNGSRHSAVFWWHANMYDGDPLQDWDKVKPAQQ